MLLLASSVCGLFKWRQFESEVILLAVGWYLRFSLSYRDVESFWPSGDCTPITSRRGGGYSVTSRQWNDVCAGYCCHSSSVLAVHSTDAWDPVDARFVACGYAGFWGKLYSLEMLFFLAGLDYPLPSEPSI